MSVKYCQAKATSDEVPDIHVTNNNATGDRVGSRFQSGGTLRGGAVYVERPADSELYRTLLAGEFAYVLAPRQIGKSSLRVHTAERLQRADVHCATIDLTKFGATETAEERWYFDLIDAIATQLALPDQADAWIRGKNRSPVYRFSLFLQSVVLGLTTRPVVIFIDEIDHVLQLPFDATDFFSAIRAVFNARASEPIFERITFCLLGVSTPQELTRDPQRTPFNIGHAIRLEDFRLEEARPAFVPALMPYVDSPDEWLAEIFSWTDGQPYMTQRLCVEIARKTESQEPRAVVNELVDRIFLQRGRVEETLLANVELRFAKSAHPTALLARQLRIYRQLIDGVCLPATGSDPAHMELRLCGLAAEREQSGARWLRVRNRVFATVFDQKWVRERETRRMFSDSFEGWLASDKSPDYLLKGHALDAALTWSHGREDLQSEEHEFLAAALVAARCDAQERQLASEAIAEREQRAREADRGRLQRRIIRALILAFAVLICASLASSVFYWRLLLAERQKIKAEQEHYNLMAKLQGTERQIDIAKIEEEKAKNGAAQNLKRAITAERNIKESRKYANYLSEKLRAIIKVKNQAQQRVDDAQQMLEITKRSAEEAQAHVQRQEEAVRNLQEVVLEMKKQAEIEAASKAERGGKVLNPSPKEQPHETQKPSIKQMQGSKKPPWRHEMSRTFENQALSTLSEAIRQSACSPARINQYKELFDGHGKLKKHTDLTPKLFATLITESHNVLYLDQDNKSGLPASEASMLDSLVKAPSLPITRFIILVSPGPSKNHDDLIRRANWVADYLSMHGVNKDRLSTIINRSQLAIEPKTLFLTDRPTTNTPADSRAVWIFRSSCL